MKKSYVVQRNTTKTYTSTGGMEMSVPPITEYSVVAKNGENEQVIANVPDHFRSPKGIAEGIAASLNTGKIILDLDI